MTASLTINPVVNKIIVTKSSNNVIISAPGPQGPAGTFNVGAIPVIYPITNVSGSIGYNTSYIPASATFSSSALYSLSAASAIYSSSADISASTAQTNFITLTLSGSNVATQSYVNAQDTLYYASAQSYANSASLNAYNSASTFTISRGYVTSAGSVSYSTNSGSSDFANNSSSTLQTNFNTLTLSGSNVATQSYVLANIPASATYSGSSLYANNSGSLGGIVSGSYALLSSPAFTGTPTAPTAGSGTNTTQVATTAYVRGEISNLVSSAPTTLDTLNELAAALGNNPNFATTTASQIGLKADATYVDSQDQAYYASAQAYATSRGYVTSSGSVAYATNAGSANYATSAGSATISTSATYSAWLDGYPASSYALLNSPSFIGTPLAPTAASNVSNTQIATTAYVNAAVTNQATLTASYGYSAYIYQTGSVTLTNGTASAVPWNQSTNQNGISYNGSSITFVYPGYYVLNYNIQMNGGSNGDSANAWFRKNGTDIPDTNYEIAFSNQSPKQLIIGTYTGKFDAGDVIQIMVLPTGTGPYIWGHASAVGQPATPGAIFNANLVTYIQAASTTPYSSSAGYASSAGTSASLGGIVSSSYALQSYVNTQDSNYYASAQAYANSASSNAYNAASAYTATGAHNNTSASVGYATSVGGTLIGGSFNSSASSVQIFSTPTTLNIGSTAGGGGQNINIGQQFITSNRSINIGAYGSGGATETINIGTSSFSSLVKNINIGTGPIVGGTNSSSIIIGAGNGTSLLTINANTIMNGTLTVNNSVNSSNKITAASFSGDGSSLNNLNASSVTSGTLSIANGGTGATTYAGARDALGILAGFQVVNTTASSSGTSLSSMFPSSTQNFALKANTAYYFEGFIALTKQASSSAVPGAWTIGFLFSNLQQNLQWKTFGTGNNTSTAALTGATYTSASAVNLGPAGTTAATLLIHYSGYFLTNATAGGTVTPVFGQQAAPTSGSALANPGSYFRLFEHGTNFPVISGSWTS